MYGCKFFCCQAKLFKCDQQIVPKTTTVPVQQQSRRSLIWQSVGVATLLIDTEAQALPGFKKDLNKGRKQKTPLSDYTEGPQGLKLYDVKVGEGQLAEVGRRVVVHYEAKWRGVTFMTSRCDGRNSAWI
eukprot:TRINITY_DN19567_c1_g1_i3.p1 TRINITY_DN19567_c1_g1~~TRINITY_DN19567_c1_g1_i3.p1  ORF type:complete len:129 (-),score=16.81 TRINITY_DN19567_c1_g1_i3:467-853(-)